MAWRYADKPITFTYEMQTRLKDYLGKGENNPWRKFREYPDLGKAEDDYLTMPHSPFVDYRMVEVVHCVIEWPFNVEEETK